MSSLSKRVAHVKQLLRSNVQFVNYVISIEAGSGYLLYLSKYLFYSFQ